MSEILLVVKTIDYRGDHAVEACLPIKVKESDTVRDLMDIAKNHSKYCRAVLEVADDQTR